MQNFLVLKRTFPEMKNNVNTQPAWSLWLPVTMAFLLVIAAWAYTIQIAKKHPTSQILIEGGSETCKDQP